MKHPRKREVQDDYETPIEAWKMLEPIVPKDKVIWDPFYCQGLSLKNFKELGYNIIHTNEDFFKREVPDCDIIISNPPFSNKKVVLEKLIEIDKPFILIYPTLTLNSRYFINLFKNRHIQFLVPNKRIKFLNRAAGKNCAFETLFFCYKMNLSNDITYL